VNVMTDVLAHGRPETPSGAVRLAGMAYAVFAYAIGMTAMAGIVAFCFNVPVPRAVDVGPVSAPAMALGIDVLLIALFGIQHSVMARPWFKRWLTRLVPEPLERATYVLATALVILPLLFFWRPVPGTLLSVSGEEARAALWGLAALGWIIVVVSTFLIDHFELFGLRQAWVWLRGREFETATFKEWSLYRIVRHPMQLGVLIGLWATPDLTVSRLVFAGGFTAYVLIGLWHEERSLAAQFGDRYRDYQARVPFLVPGLRRRIR
jgi:protein-S-isoprenylcysteine O-methyltransferase Ste14